MPLKSEIIIQGSPTELSAAAAGLFTMRARDCVEKKQHFIVALSGGSTPRGMHKLLAEEPYRSRIPWRPILICWVDERCVPKDDPASNYGVAKKDFLDQVPVPADQVHPMPGEMAPEDGALKYQDELIRIFQLEPGKFPVFDLIFLGIGKDGHTASLFPGHSALNEQERMVVTVKGGDPDVNRLTMTFPVLNRARQIVFMVSGKEKAEIVKAILASRETGLPAEKIQPMSGRLTWLLDRDGASLVSAP